MGTDRKQRGPAIVALGGGHGLSAILRGLKLYTEDLTAIGKSSSNVPEPLADEPVADDETALVLMPGLAFDREGHRMGYGGGYYDKFLAAEPNHPTVALCFDFQIVEHIPTEEFDIPVDLVLSV